MLMNITEGKRRNLTLPNKKAKQRKWDKKKRIADLKAYKKKQKELKKLKKKQEATEEKQ